MILSPEWEHGSLFIGNVGRKEGTRNMGNNTVGSVVDKDPSAVCLGNASANTVGQAYC